MMKCDVILAAGGAGQRYEGDLPKQFDEVHGRPLYLWSLDVFLSWPRTGQVVMVAPENWVEPLKESLKILINHSSIQVVAGGSSRQMSAALGLAAIEKTSANEWVMIHDAARPAFTQDLLERLWKVCESNKFQEGFGGAVPGLPARETIKSARHQGQDLVVDETLPRESLYVIQTPQLLKREHLTRAYKMYESGRAVDDASLLEKMGLKIVIVDGENDNVKVTFKEDKERVAHWLGKRHPQI